MRPKTKDDACMLVPFPELGTAASTPDPVSPTQITGGAAKPWLSVLIPTHGGERWLGATLDSLAAQTRGDFECILVDSSASDATLAVAEGFRSVLALRILQRRDLVDWQGKTNLAATLAGADHLCMLHQDDLWEPTRAARIFSWISERPGTVMHLHPAWIVDSGTRKLGLWRCPLPTDKPIPRDLFLERLLVQNFVAICAPVIRTDTFIAVDGLDRTLWYTADWDLYLKLGLAGDVVYHHEALANYRVHAGALTVSGSRSVEDFDKQMRSVLDRHAPAIATARRKAVVRRARTAIEVNVALSRALHGAPWRLLPAALRMLGLGPLNLHALLRDTRLVERLLPRLRTHLSGRLALK